MYHFSYNSHHTIDDAVFWILAANIVCVLWIYIGSRANSEAKNLVAALTIISFVIAIGFAVTPGVSARDVLPTILVFCTFLLNFGYCTVLETMTPHNPRY